jgi:Holliday junction resolvasome RuvABC ATP-dependent DNA helicase subunit
VNCPNCGHCLAKGKRAMVEKIRDGRQAGLTIAAIAKVLGVHPSTVEKYCATYGIRKNFVTKPLDSGPDALAS